MPARTLPYRHWDAASFAARSSLRPEFSPAKMLAQLPRVFMEAVTAALTGPRSSVHLL
ncbi:MAG: hypothetical protein KY463_12535 [Actinobacteria bacterium]|nr:hypothetical protein [Actinomycetota bacterium]